MLTDQIKEHMNKYSYEGADMRLCDVKHIHTAHVEKARGQLVPDNAIRDAAGIFKALGDPSRLKLVMALRSCELCVCDLAAVSGIPESAASHQLRVLRNLGIVAYCRGIHP
jgi:hypothetical protein